MNKAVKLSLISLATIFVILLITIFTLSWVIFTPEKLTPIVRDQLSKNITCKFELQDVELTFFSTFPSFGIQINKFLLLNPMPGAPSDTLFYADMLIADVDFNALRNRNELIISEIYLDNSFLTLFSDQSGKVNYDIMREDEVPDTTAFKLPFELLDIKKISLKHTHIVYADQQMNLLTEFKGLQGKVNLTMKDVLMEGKMDLETEDFSLNWDSTQYILNSSLGITSPFALDIARPQFRMKEAGIVLAGHDFRSDIFVDMNSQSDEILTDINFSANQQNLKSFVDLLSLAFGEYFQGMEMDGLLDVEGSLKGKIADKLLPHFKLNLSCVETTFSYESLPYKLFDISAIAEVVMDLNKEENWFVRVHAFDAKTLGSQVTGSGLIDQLTGDMRFDLTTRLKLNLVDAKPMLPNDMPIVLKGLATGDAKLKFLYSDYEKDAYNRINIETNLRITDFVADYDTINLKSKDARLKLKWPLKQATFLQFATSSGLLEVKMGKKTTADIRNLNMQVMTSDFFKSMKNLDVKAVLVADKLHAAMDSIFVETGKISFNTDANYNNEKKSLLAALLAHGNVSLKEGIIQTNYISDQILIPEIAFSFTPDRLDIQRGSLQLAGSDFNLSGKLSNLQQYLKKEGLLVGDFDFNSSTTDVNYLMSLTNGLGYNDIPDTKDETKVSTGSGPFMVPKGIDLTLRTKVDRAFIAKDTARDVSGSLTIKDGTLVLESMLFTASAARMQLTGIYQTPRKNHLFAGLDFHLLDIEIEELLAMIPDVDSIMPMLRSFSGKGEFHIAIETYLDSLYNLKWSTLRGISSIKGENLVLMDGETFSEIAKKLMFNKKTVNRVDSLAAEFSIFRNEVDIYPFLIVMDKYKAIVSGRHLLDMNFDYHISLVNSPLPVQLGLDVKGNLDNMKFNLVPCKYPNLYRPARRNELEKKQLDIKNKIREALKANLKE